MRIPTLHNVPEAVETERTAIINSLDDHPDISKWFDLFDALLAVEVQTIATIWADGRPEVYRAAQLWCVWRGCRLDECPPNPPTRKAHSVWIYRGDTFNALVTIRLDDPDANKEVLPESRL